MLEPLRAVLTAFRERPFVFVRAGWNWGDVLIYVGAEQLAAEVGLQFRTLEFDQFMNEPATDEVIYLHGGGGFIATSSGKASRALQKAVSTPGATVIQGPCTLADAHALDDVDFSARRAAEIIFFTRERTSALLADTLLSTSIDRHLNEDTAFYMTKDVILAGTGEVRPRLDLAAIREDPEATPRRKSTAGLTAIDPARFAQSFDHWLRIHAVSRSILTDRTHSAVCGAILGVPTTMFAGAYHKNRSIWEFSLRDRSVQWLENAIHVPVPPTIDPWLDWIPVQAVQQSWKLDRYAKRLRGIPLA